MQIGAAEVGVAEIAGFAGPENVANRRGLSLALRESQPDIEAPVKSMPLRFAFVKSHLAICALRKDAPARLAPVKSAAPIWLPEKFEPDRFAFEKSTPVYLTPRKSRPDQLTPA